MKHIEISRKINLGRAVTAEELKKTLMSRLENVIEVQETSGNAEQFHVSGSTGAPVSMTRYAQVDIDATITTDDSHARILLNGYVRTAPSLMILYGVLFFVLLCVGLLPGFVDTSIDGDAGDALIFVLIGMFLVYDINRRLAEPQEQIESILESMNTLYS